MKLARQWNQAEVGACELRSKIRTNYPARTLWHASVNFAVIDNSPIRQLPNQPMQAAAQVLGGVALALGSAPICRRRIDWRFIGENRRLPRNVNAIPWHVRKFHEFGLVSACRPQF